MVIYTNHKIILKKIFNLLLELLIINSRGILFTINLIFGNINISIIKYFLLNE